MGFRVVLETGRLRDPPHSPTAGLAGGADTLTVRVVKSLLKGLNFG